MIIPCPTVEVKHIWQVYVTRHGMNFHSFEKQIFKSFGCTKIYKDSKWTKANQNEVMHPTTSNNDSRAIFPYHVYKQTDFENPFLNLIYLGISKMSFTS